MHTPELTAITPYNRQAGSSRVRVFDWIDYLGVDVQLFNYADLPNFSSRTLMLNRSRLARSEFRMRSMARTSFDHLLLSREATPFSIGGVEAKLLRRAGHSAYDFDDALQWDTGTGVRRLANKPRKCRQSVLSADTVIAGNDVLAEWAAGYSKNVIVIPSCVMPSQYRPKSDWSLGDPPILVWLGSPSTESYLAHIADPLLKLNARFGARLRIISAGSTSLGALDQMTDRVPWTQDTFAADLASADIGVGPLVDTPYARGKSSYKLLQYGATALPMVVSPVGTNASVAQVLGALTASTAKDWYFTLESLILSSANERSVAGRASREAVTDHFSFKSWEMQWSRAVGLSD